MNKQIVKNPFYRYDLYSIGMMLDSKAFSPVSLGKIFILKHALSSGDDVWTEDDILTMFFDILDKATTQEEFESLLTLPAPENEILSRKLMVKMIDREIAPFEKLMKKWISGENSKANYFVLNYSKYLQGMCRDFRFNRFFGFSGRLVTEKSDLSEALLLQIKHLMTCDVLETGLEIWRIARNLLSDLIIEDSFLQEFIKRFHEETKKFLNIGMEESRTRYKSNGAINAFIYFDSLHIEDFGYLEVEDRNKYRGFYRSLKKESVELTGCRLLDLHTALMLRESFMKSMAENNVDLNLEILACEREILSCTVKK